MAGFLELFAPETYGRLQRKKQLSLMGPQWAKETNDPYIGGLLSSGDPTQIEAGYGLLSDRKLKDIVGTPPEAFGSTPRDDEGNPMAIPGKGFLGGQLSPQQFYAQLAGLGGDYTKYGMTGLTHQPQETELIRNLKAAGISPGSPQFAEIVANKYNTLNDRGEYFVPVNTAEGVRAFDSRRGVITDPATKSPVTKPVIPGQFDPNLQRDLGAGKAYGKEIGEAVSAIGGKYDALDSLREASAMLKKGIYSGYWGELKKNFAKATPGIDTTKAANTEQFVSYIGNTVIPRLKEFGGNDSNEELRYLTKIMGGDTSMEEKTLKAVLESSEKKIQAGIKRLRGQGQQVNLPDPQGNPQGNHQRVRRYNPATGKIE